MNATFSAPISTRVVAFAAAILTSAFVLGATVLGMAPERNAGLDVVALEQIVITAPSIH